MTNEEGSRLPARPDDGEIEIAVQPEGLLVGGDPEAVKAYLERLRVAAGKTMRVVDIDKSSISNAAGLLAGAAAFLADSGKFVQLHPESLTALKTGNWIPGTDGFYRMMTRGNDGLFLQQLQWAPAQIAPPQMMAVQLVATQIALKTAIAEVEQAIRRVEGKVESVLQLADASRAGDVLGNHLSIRRAVEFLEKHDVLPNADWDALASLGPALNVAVEQLRNHATRLLESFDSELPVQDRAEKLRCAVEDNRLGETLSLLVVAEESLYQWQRLRLARVEATQPEHLQRVVDDTRDLLTLQLAEDGKLYRSAEELLDDFAKPDAIEGFRFFSVRELVKQRANLRDELDRFAEARRHQVEEWEAVETPGVLDAAAAVVDAISESALKAVGAAGQGMVRFGEYLTEKGRTEKSELQKPVSDESS
ncbi:hypothetical protein [Mycobacterium sp. 852014-52144_SCH5372336]|uniref:hypothetical protein n=1 Tax=Mycobacterium sp. 852014-52144_SCH5372336 TaxID=1834115 RepID=UPI0008004A92|nr:hypothetical protein [Mycobacterium sp. 852014-52144_SCH5372336]OBB77113.1 hypothetical protein A5759_04600 [Mycobacterium sp. 852014-52144_SCH5372336]